VTATTAAAIIATSTTAFAAATTAIAATAAPTATTVATATTTTATVTTSTTTAAAIAAATSTSATTAAIAPTAARGTILFRASDIHIDATTIEFLTVKAIDGSLRFFRRAHGHKSEATRLAGHFVRHERGFDHGSESPEGIEEHAFSRGEGQVSDEEFILH
jgi:hypothetical protein